MQNYTYLICYAHCSLHIYTLRQLQSLSLLIIFSLRTHYANYNPSLCLFLSPYVHITPITTHLYAYFSLPMYTLRQLQPLSLLIILSLCTHYANYNCSLCSCFSLYVHYANYNPSLCSLFSPYVHITPITNTLYAYFSLHMYTLRKLQPLSMLIILFLCTHYANYNPSLCSLFSPYVHIAPNKPLSLLIIMSLCTHYANYNPSL